MGLGFRRTVTSCFCAEGCPRGTYPYRRYFVEAFFIVGPSYGNKHILYQFIGMDGATCVWTPVTKELGPGSIEELRKIPIIDGAGVSIGWRWDLILFDGGGGNTWSLDILPPYLDDIPYPPQSAKSCSKRSWILLHTFAGPISPATLSAAFPNACDNDDWPAKAQARI